jgi:hypothetical protein
MTSMSCRTAAAPIDPTRSLFAGNTCLPALGNVHATCKVPDRMVLVLDLETCRHPRPKGLVSNNTRNRSLVNSLPRPLNVFFIGH